MTVKGMRASHARSQGVRPGVAVCIIMLHRSICRSASFRQFNHHCRGVTSQLSICFSRIRALE